MEGMDVDNQAPETIDISSDSHSESEEESAERYLYKINSLLSTTCLCTFLSSLNISRDVASKVGSQEILCNKSISCYMI